MDQRPVEFNSPTMIDMPQLSTQHIFRKDDHTIDDCPICSTSSNSGQFIVCDSIFYNSQQLYFTVDLCCECGCIYSVHRTKGVDLYTQQSNIEGQQQHQSEEIRFDESAIWNLGNKTRQSLEILEYCPSPSIKYLEVGSSDGSLFFLTDKLFRSKQKKISGTLVESTGSSEKCREILGCEVFSKSILTPRLLPDNQYDIAVLSHCLEHFDNPREVLSIVAKSLKDKGILYIEVPDGMNMDRGITSPLGYFHIVNYNLINFIELITSCGFKVVDAIVRDTYPGIRVVAQLSEDAEFVSARKHSHIWSQSAIAAWQRQMTNVLSLLKEKFSLLEMKEKVLIYGLGVHTKKIVESFPELLANKIFDFTDSANQVAIHFGQQTILHEKLNFDDYRYVLISSYAYQEPIYNFLLDLHCPEEKIIRLYSYVYTYVE